MILITKIECVETDKDIAQLHSLCYDQNYIAFNDNTILESKVVTEIIHGRRLVNKDKNIDVLVGFSNQVGELLGMTNEYMNSLETDINLLRSQNKLLNSKCLDLLQQLTTIKKYNFLKRLKCLIYGIK